MMGMATHGQGLPDRKAPATDTIGGFPEISPNCSSCCEPLKLENAWMTDGCQCNGKLGCNSMNETRWRLLMELQQRQSRAIEEITSGLREQVGGNGSLDLRPSLKSAAKFCETLAKQEQHTEAVADCCHCNLLYASRSIQRLVGAIDAALETTGKALR